MRPIEPWPYWEQFWVSINSQRQAKRVEEISTVLRLCSVFGSALTLHYLQNVRRNISNPSTPSISLLLLSPSANPPYSAWASPALICSSLMFFFLLFLLTFHSLSEILLHLPLPKALSLPHQHRHTPTHSQSHTTPQPSVPPSSPILPQPLSFISVSGVCLFSSSGVARLASCQGRGAVYVWLCYHIALPMQLSPIRTKRNPVSYWPLMFNETGV